MHIVQEHIVQLHDSTKNKKDIDRLQFACLDLKNSVIMRAAQFCFHDVTFNNYEHLVTATMSISVATLCVWVAVKAVKC